MHYEWLVRIYLLFLLIINWQSSFDEFNLFSSKNTIDFLTFRTRMAKDS